MIYVMKSGYESSLSEDTVNETYGLKLHGPKYPYLTPKHQRLQQYLSETSISILYNVKIHLYNIYNII